MKNYKKLGIFLINKKANCEHCNVLVGRPTLIIHHKDGNHHNDNPSNFQLLCNACHMRHHRTGAKMSDVTKEKLKHTFFGSKPSWNKGIPMREESKQKLSLAQKGIVKRSDDFKLNLSSFWAGKPKRRCSCLLCHKEVTANHITQHLKGKQCNPMNIN